MLNSAYYLDKNIKKFLLEKSGVIVASRPKIFNLKNKTDKIKFNELINSEKIHCIIDDYKEQQKEYFQIINPSWIYRPDFEEKFFNYLIKLQRKTPLWAHGRWVYFPWLSTLVHILEEKAFYLTRTARNKNLINKREQDKFYNSVVGIAGLSLGNSVALAIALQGGAKYIRIADQDRLALSNLNRVRAGVDNLGLLKTEITARQIYVLNPYANVEVFSEGLTEENIEKFFFGPPKLSIVVDEIDNLAVKYLIRERAKKYKLAVIMAADNGDNAVVDIERYDKNLNLLFFHGRIGKVTYKKLLNLDKFSIGKMITKHIGSENVTERMRESLLEIGKTIVSWPQLGGTALINGSVVAYCVRKILNKQNLENNRALISLDEKLIPGYNSLKQIKKNRKEAKEFRKNFGF